MKLTGMADVMGWSEGRKEGKTATAEIVAITS